MSQVRLVLAWHDDPPTEHRAGIRRLVRNNTECLGLPPDVRVGNTCSGAPYIQGTDMHISLTHDRHWAAAATSTTPVGVDVQRVEACTPTFRRRLGCTTDREASRSWCIREAISKLRGRGLVDAPWRYSLDTNATDATNGTYEEAHWFCTTLRDDTFLAVATHEPATVHLQEVPHDDHHPNRDPRPHHLSRPRCLAAV